MARHLSYDGNTIPETSVGFVKYTNSAGTQYDLNDVWWTTYYNSSYLVWTKVAKLYLTNNQCPSGDFNVTNWIWTQLQANGQTGAAFIEVINNSSSHSGSFVFENNANLVNSQIRLINYGTISGKGGTAGKPGGTALTVKRSLTIENHGTIAGGGGGGGNGKKGGNTNSWVGQTSSQWTDWKSDRAYVSVSAGNINVSGSRTTPPNVVTGYCARHMDQGCDIDKGYLFWNGSLVQTFSWGEPGWACLKTPAPSNQNFHFNDINSSCAKYRIKGGRSATLASNGYPYRSKGKQYRHDGSYVGCNGATACSSILCFEVERKTCYTQTAPSISGLTGGRGGTGGKGKGCNNHTEDNGTSGSTGPSKTVDGVYKKAGNGGSGGKGGAFGKGGAAGGGGTKSSDGNNPTGTNSAGAAGLAINGVSKCNIVVWGTITGARV